MAWVHCLCSHFLCNTMALSHWHLTLCIHPGQEGDTKNGHHTNWLRFQLSCAMVSLVLLLGRSFPPSACYFATRHEACDPQKPLARLGQKGHSSNQIAPGCRDQSQPRNPKILHTGRKEKERGVFFKFRFYSQTSALWFDVRHGIQEDASSFPGTVGKDGCQIVQKQYVLSPAQHAQARVFRQLPLPAGADTFG